MAAKKKTAKNSEKKQTKTTKDPALNYIASLKKEGLLGNIAEKIDFIPTGSYVLNRLIGDGTLTDSPGGFPRGYMVELYGDEGCGKTTIALHAAKQAQLAGGNVIFADFEHSLRTQYVYIKNIGVDINPPKFIHLQPNNFEEGAAQIGKGLRDAKPTLIIVDSVTAMLPKSTFESDADSETQIGKHAKLTGTFLSWMNKRLEKANCCLLLLNQLRSAIKGQYERGPREITSGGRSIRFFTSLRIKLQGTSNAESVSQVSGITGDKETKKVSMVVKAIVEKSKIDIPFKSGPVYITFGQGIDNILSLIQLGINKKIIKKSGGWFEWVDPNGKYSFKKQGILKVKSHLEQNPDILEALKPHLSPSQDIRAKKNKLEELEDRGWENLTEDEQVTLKSLRKEFEGVDASEIDDDDLDTSELDDDDDDGLESLTSKLDKINKPEDKGSEDLEEV